MTYIGKKLHIDVSPSDVGEIIGEGQENSEKTVTIRWSDGVKSTVDLDYILRYGIFV